MPGSDTSETDATRSDASQPDTTRSDARPSSPFSRPVAPETLRGAGPFRLSAVADAAERAAAARSLDVPEIAALAIDVELSPSGADGWRASGRLRAELTQLCVVTLSPLSASIDEPIARRWSAAGAAPDILDVDPTSADDALDEAEPTPDPIDLGALALEALSLAIDPYPRAPDAVFEPVAAAPPGAAPLDAAAEKPFAALAALRQKSDPDGDGA